MEKVIYIFYLLTNTQIFLFWLWAAALQLAIETDRIEFAPNLDLLSVPSKLINNSSIFSWSKESFPLDDC